jgi:two-component system, OmpR family, sensor histidine kinase BaeS
MKSKLSYKIFGVFTLMSVMVVVLMVGIMRYFVTRNFTDYVNKSALERYSDFADALAAEYRHHRGWQTLKNNPERWEQILRSSLPLRDLDDRPPAPPPSDIESRQPGVSPEKLTSVKFSRRMQRSARRLVLFDTEKQRIAGARVQASFAEYELQKIDADGHTVGWLGLHKRQNLSNPLVIVFLKQQYQAFYIIGGVILLLAAVVAFFLSEHFLAPIRKLTAGTRALAARRFDTRIQVVSGDELGQLAADFNTMALALENDEHMRQQWISDIAHELRTPLAILEGEVEALKDGIRKVNRDTLDSLHTEVRHLSKIVNDLHELSLADAGMLSIKKEPIDCVQVLNETLRRFKLRFDQRQITVENSLEDHPPITVMGDSDRLQQLFANLIENTLRYADSPGKLKVGHEHSANRLILFLEDSGPGVPEASLAKLFDRLYRVDRSRSRIHGGSGLGLSICKSIIVALGGKIRATNAAGGGLRIEIEFLLT